MTELGDTELAALRAHLSGMIRARWGLEPAVAEDLVQSALADLLEWLSHQRESALTLEGQRRLARRILVRRAADHFRRRARLGVDDVDLEQVAADDMDIVRRVHYRRQLAVVWQFIGELSPSDQTLLLEATVGLKDAPRRRRARLRRRLQEYLAHHVPDPDS